MSSKNEKYKSKSSKAKHEKRESTVERQKEYGPSGGTKKVSKVMREFKAGTLHSGKGGPVVKSRKQAVAIAMSEAGMAQKKRKKKK